MGDSSSHDSDRGRSCRSADAAELERAVRAAVGGSGTAWAALVERFAARLRSVARAHRLAAHDVDDVVQTTWLRLVEHLGSVQKPAAVGAWLETTARRESLRLLTTRERERPADAELLERETIEPHDSDGLVDAERWTAVATALRSLPPRQHELLTLLMAEPGPSYAEISRTLRMPIGSIGPTRERGLARLRRALDLDGGADQVAA